MIFIRICLFLPYIFEGRIAVLLLFSTFCKKIIIMRSNDCGCWLDLQHDVGDDDEEREGEVDEEPDLDRFDPQSAG